jgi:hypothetical protein
MLDALVVLGWVQTSGLDSLRNVVTGLIGLEDSRTRQLTRIESKVDAMLDSSYGSALDYLASARRAGLDTDKGKTYLDKSIHDFRKAAANYDQVAPRRASWACLHLLLLYTALGDTPEAQEWGARGYEAAIRWAQEEIRVFRNRHELRRGKWSLFTLATVALIILDVVFSIKGSHGHLAIGASKSALITITTTYLIVSFWILLWGNNLYRAVVSALAMRQMHECTLFLDQMYRVWAKLSPNPEAVKFYTIYASNEGTWGLVKHYDLIELPHPLDPSKNQLLRFFDSLKNGRPSDDS